MKLAQAYVGLLVNFNVTSLRLGLRRLSLSPNHSNVVSAGGGYYHSCAALADGSAWCWGDNSAGQLGDGTTIGAGKPVRVGALGTDVASIAAGYSFTCAIAKDSTLSCWGANGVGQLGVGDLAKHLVPTRVTTDVRAVATGMGHACALKNDGTIWCWGDNSDGQLGIGQAPSSAIPVKVGAISGAIAVSVGEAHSCALRQDGTLWCWGSNGVGALGTGGNGSSTPVQVAQSCP